MDPVASLIGSVLLGLGFTLVYGAYKNRKVFGGDGVIAQALTKGSITDIDDASIAFGGFAGGAVLGGGGGMATGGTSKLEHAFNLIKAVDAGLGDDIANRTYAASSGSTRAELMPLAQLLLIADAKGLRDSTATIRAHIKEVTGESI